MTRQRKRKVREAEYIRYYRDLKYGGKKIAYAVHATPDAADDPEFWKAMDALVGAAYAMETERLAPRRAKEGGAKC